MLVFAYLVAILAVIGLFTIVNAIEQRIMDTIQRKKQRRKARLMRAGGLAALRDFYERERKKEFMRNTYEWGKSL